MPCPQYFHVSYKGRYNFHEHLNKLLNIFIFIALCEIIDNIYTYIVTIQVPIVKLFSQDVTVF